MLRLVLLAAAALAFAPLPSAAASGDPERGADIYSRCGACHSLERNRSGPKHCGLYGRPAASVPEYAYSPALKKSGIVWDEKTLDTFLENPLKTVPGTRMGYAGLKNAQDRADIIAYLREASRDPEKCG